MMRHSGHQTACAAVIEAVATQKGVDPTSLTEQLYESIDPDALNTTCRTNSVDVTFEYYGYLVTIDDENQVDLTELPQH